MAKKRPFEESEIQWGDGEPSKSGDCVFLNLENSTENTWLSTGNCADTRNFICEVLYFGRRYIEMVYTVECIFVR